MTVTLFDKESDEIIFDVNFWHWRAIVEAVRRAAVLPPERIEGLHTPFVGGLETAEARRVAHAIREHVLPTLRDGERLLLRGAVTDEPDDHVLHRSPDSSDRNYSTTRDVLESFAVACERCAGFDVR